MRAVRCAGGSVEVVDVEAPTGDVVIDVVAAGLCGTDLHLIETGLVDGRILGHEIAGSLPDGRAVAIEPVTGCGGCDHCIDGDYNICPVAPLDLLGIAADGGMAERVAVPEGSIVELPGGVDPRNASLVEPLAVTAHGFRLVRESGARWDRIGVVGAGTIGLCAVATGRHNGLDVDISTRHEAQQAAADRLGSGPLTDEPYDVIIDAAGTESSLAEAVDRCRPGGTVLVVATYWDAVALPAMPWSLKEIRLLPAIIYGRHDAGRDIDDAAQALADVPEISSIITHRFPLEGAVEAFATATDRAAGAIKVVLEPAR
ncbi:MAG: alcohol dehydrogenase catalytic domain-containing protein [Acidimicrobiia bacterium]|nr:alcohol dehydrogenase catalytic domain-containing protein [Acidimicrobiia bacterium]